MPAVLRTAVMQTAFMRATLIRRRTSDASRPSPSRMSSALPGRRSAPSRSSVGVIGGGRRECQSGVSLVTLQAHNAAAAALHRGDHLLGVQASRAGVPGREPPGLPHIHVWMVDDRLHLGHSRVLQHHRHRPCSQQGPNLLCIALAPAGRMAFRHRLRPASTSRPTVHPHALWPVPRLWVPTSGGGLPGVRRLRGRGAGGGSDLNRSRH